MTQRFHDIKRTSMVLLLCLSACHLDAQTKSKSSGFFGLFRSSKEAEILEATKPRPKPVRQDSIDNSKEYGLAGLVDLGLQNNPKTSIAWQTARIKAASLNQTRSDYYPKLSASFEAGGAWEMERDVTSSGLTLTETSPTSPTLTPSLSLTWILFDLERDFATKSARMSLVSARRSFDRTMQEVIANVQRAYLQLDEDIALYDAGKAALELAAKTDEAITAKFKAGLTDRGAFLQAHQNLEQARYDLQANEEQRSTSRAVLMLAVGLPANTPIKIKMINGQSSMDKVASSVDRLIDNALRSRPDIAAQYAEVRAMELSVLEAEAAWVPTITLGGSYSSARSFDRVLVHKNTVDDHPSTKVDDTLTDTFIGLTVSMDIFDGFNRKAEIDEARANLESAREELIQVELQASGDVWNSYFKYRSALKKVAYAKKLLETSQSAEEAVVVGYKQGLKTILDVLDAQNKLAESQATLISARTEQLATSVDLAYATGSTSPSKPRVVGEK